MSIPAPSQAVLDTSRSPSKQSLLDEISHLASLLLGPFNHQMISLACYSLSTAIHTQNPIIYGNITKPPQVYIKIVLILKMIYLSLLTDPRIIQGTIIHFRWAISLTSVASAPTANLSVSYIYLEIWWFAPPSYSLPMSSLRSIPLISCSLGW